MRFSIADRRLNPHGKNLSNRQRFVERVRASVKHAANKQVKSRALQDKSDTEVGVSRDTIEEPQFHYAPHSGQWDYVLPGNKNYEVGDTIDKPPAGGGGRGSEGSPDGDGEDDFRFYITYEEYIDAILGDLSLPDMIKSAQRDTVSYSLKRAGYSRVGATSNLALEKTMIQGIGRRIALKSPKLREIEELEAQLEDETDADARLEIEERISTLRRQADAISFLDKSDLRYNNFTKQAKPISSAVMLCAMDVSGSMTEHMKDLAKRFYLLLYVFLTRQYEHVDIVFIRHSHYAAEVDQDTFFNSPESGGTIVSTAYDEVKRIIRERYDVADWNIYLAQASDGDNMSYDNDKAHSLLEDLLPWMQYVTYVEVGPDNDHLFRRDSDLWTMFEELQKDHPHVAARRLTKQDEVVEVFRSLFKTKTVAAA